ncbi:hypothetical protein BSL78_10897 [Apostichopus japonicus]|uniref:Uncharacterized protein n=1 Tax=Stichopus japonicus TaxID=307972 RepID=A0A2G8KW52_STIJA|nr:hypothetical protein BSL78_10897 [Apostichopus japonicus]
MVIAGAQDGTVTCYQRTEYGRQLTSLMRTVEERTTESMTKEENNRATLIQISVNSADYAHWDRCDTPCVETAEEHPH